MKKSEKIFVIGKKVTKSFIFLFALLPFSFSLLVGGMVIERFRLGDYAIGIIAITFLVIWLLFIPNMARWRQHWDITEQYLEHYAVDGYFQQLKYILSIFNGNEDMFAFKIKLTEIKSIRLYWHTVWVISSTPLHSIYFGIILKDGSVVTFRSLLTTSNREYIDAVNHLKEKFNIQIEDKYNLLGAMEDTGMRLAEYIDEIEKQEGKWRTQNDQS